MKIAVAGKGGVGKTTVSAALSRFFAAMGYEIFAVDADPDLSLGTVLGIPGEKLSLLRPIVEMHDVIKEISGGEGVLFSLNPDVSTLLDKYSLQIGNIRFFKMGSVKRGGTSCYCRENSVLHALVSSLLLERREMVLLDMGAGIEHLTRGTARGVDIMLIVTEPTEVSISTAKNVRKLASDLGISRVGIIVNKISDEEDRKIYRENFTSSEIFGEIAYSESVRRNRPDDNFYAEIRRIGREILKTRGLCAAEGMEG